MGKFTLAHIVKEHKFTNSITFNVSEDELVNLYDEKMVTYTYYYVEMYNNKPAYSNGFYRMVWLDEGVDEETGVQYEAGYYFFEETEYIDVSDYVISKEELIEKGYISNE